MNFLNNRSIIIAEVGVNHNGDINIAKKLIENASSCGADVVKFQTFSADRLVTNGAELANYQKEFSKKNITQLQMLKKYELKEHDYLKIVKLCNKLNIDFLSTGFDIESLRFLQKFDMNFIKVPSGEITNLPYLRYVGSLKKKILLSTGMSNLSDIENAISILEDSGTKRNNICILHCNTEYPTPMIDVNLNAMKNLGLVFQTHVGYSDHTEGISVPIAAIALGAKVIEKHLTLDKNMTGPDHKASLEPKAFKEMVLAIRDIEQALGDGIKRLTKSESKNIVKIRKSIVALKNIKKGEIFSSNNLTTKRPASGVSPMLWDEINGKVAKKNFVKDELIII